MPPPPAGGMPGAMPGAPPPTAPMTEAPPAPLPANPRMNPPSPKTSQQAMQEAMKLNMLEAKQSPPSASEGVADLQTQGMAMGAKMAQFAKRSDEFGYDYDTSDEDATGAPTAMSKGWQWRFLNKDVTEGQKQWMPRLFRSQHTPMKELLSSPGKGGVLGALLGGAAGGLAGGFGGEHMGVEPGIAGPAGAGIGALLGGIGMYGHRRRRNDEVIDAMRHLPAGSTVGDWDGLKNPKPAKATKKADDEAMGAGSILAETPSLGLSSMPGSAMAGGVLGSLLGYGRGNTAEGLGRGIIRGGLTGGGMGIGGGLGAAAATQMTSPAARSLAILGGLGVGGLGGYALGGKLLGKPVGAKRDKDGRMKSGGDLKTGFEKSAFLPQLLGGLGRGLGHTLNFAGRAAGTGLNLAGRGVAATGRGVNRLFGGGARPSAPAVPPTRATMGNMALPPTSTPALAETMPTMGRMAAPKRTPPMGLPPGPGAARAVPVGLTPTKIAPEALARPVPPKVLPNAYKNNKGIPTTTQAAAPRATAPSTPSPTGAETMPYIGLPTPPSFSGSRINLPKQLLQMNPRDAMLKFRELAKQRGLTPQQEDAFAMKLFQKLMGPQPGLPVKMGADIHLGDGSVRDHDELARELAERLMKCAKGNPETELLHDTMLSYLRPLQKQASQDSSFPAVSATGESKGLAFQNKKDNYAQGQEAWASVGQYFRGERKREPNPFKGDHKGKQASDFAQGFLDCCEAMGLSKELTKLAMEKAAAEFGGEVAAELNDAMTKTAVNVKQIGDGLQAGWRGVKNFFGGGGSNLSKARTALNTAKEQTASRMGAPGMSGALNRAEIDAAKNTARHGLGMPTRSPTMQRPPGFEGPMPQARPGMSIPAGHVPAGQAEWAAGQMARPGLGIGAQVLPTALGGVGGGFAGMDNDMGFIPGALAGAAAFNPRRRQIAARNPGMQMAMRPIQHATMGSMTGHGLEFLHRSVGSPFSSGMVKDPHTGEMTPAPLGLGRTFSRLGFASGLAHGGLSNAASRFTPGSAAQVLGAKGSGMMNRVSNTIDQFGNSMFRPMMSAVTYLPRRMTNYLANNSPKFNTMVNNMAGVAPGGANFRFGTKVLGDVPKGFHNALGFAGGTAALGGMGIATVGNMMENKVKGAVSERMADVMPMIEERLGQFGQQQLDQLGLLGQDGQIDISGVVNQAMNGGPTGGIDTIFKMIGMDPTRMSPMQKIMILGGTAAGAGGALGGSAGMAAGGGLAALGGLLPYLMQGQGQRGQGQGMGMEGGQGYQHPNAPGYRDEWRHQTGQF